MKKSFVFAALSAMVLFASCDKNGKDDPKIDPKDPASVAKEALVAYLPFETEAIGTAKSLTLDKNQGVTFTKGRRGNCYQGAEGAYITYNIGADSPFKTMTGFAISAWVKAPGNSAAGILTINGGDPTMSNVMLFVDGWNGETGTLAMKGYLYNEPTTWKGQDLRVDNEAFPIDKWFHIVFQYNGETSTMALYANGQMIADSIRYADGVQGDGTQPLLGNLHLAQDMTQLIIGCWPKNISGGADDWMKNYTGNIDELRIYNRALTDEEIQTLYNNEVEYMD